MVAAKRTGDWRLYCRLLVVTFAALFLRGGVLGLLTLTWGWPAQAAIAFAVIAGWTVTTLGYAWLLSTPDGGTRPLAIGIIVYALALRLVYLGAVQLLPEEAYYWNYSRHLDIGYLDHPPMVAWLIRLGTAVFGQSQFGVRIGAFCCGILASIFAYRLTRNLFGEPSALAALVLAQTLPFFFLSGFLMTPDAPLTAAWVAALYYLERALIGGRPAAWWGAGIALGMGFVSKYSIGLLVPVALIYMIWDRKSHQWWRRWEPYAAALLALAIFSPVIVWNSQHDWASFEFQTLRRLAETPRFSLHKLIGSALILITPTGVLAVVAAFSSPKSLDSGGDASRRWRLLTAAIVVPLTVFAVFSLRHEVKLDWTGAPWIASLPVMAAGIVATASPSSGFRAWIRRAWRPTLVTLLLSYGAGLHYLVLGLPGLGYSKHMELIPIGWRGLSRHITETAAEFREAPGHDALIVGMDRYVIASELAFYGAELTKSAVETSSPHLFQGIGLMYERWTPPELQDGRDLLLIAWDPRDLSGKEIETHVDRLGRVEDAVLMHDGQVVRHYYHRFAYNYRKSSRP